MKVNVEDVSLVQPITHSMDQKFELSFFDHLLWFINYWTGFLFYPNPNSAFNPSAVPSILKHSLSKALVDFFPFAGRIQVQENGSGMLLLCNGAGAQFTQAYTHLAMADLGDFRLLSLRLSQELSQTVGHPLLWPWSPETPLLFIQLTRFSCGGLCISFKFCHQICDGTSIWRFLHSWSAIARGEGICVVPDINYSPKIWSFPDQKDLQISELYCLEITKRSKIPRPGELQIDSNSVVTHCFSFSADQIVDLKRQAGLKLGQERLSTFQVASAHIWHHITKARGLADDDITKLIFSLSCRNRLDGLSDSYFGNAIIPLSSRLKAGNITENEYLGVEAIRITTKKATIPEDLLKVCRIIKRYTEDAEDTLSIPVNYGYDVWIGSSNTFAYEGDFGFGRLEGLAISPLSADGKVYYFPGKQKGSIDAFIGLHKDVMDILKSTVAFVPSW